MKGINIKKMNKKQEFLNFLDELLLTAQLTMNDVPEGARIYWEALKNTKEIEKPLFTDNGKLILQYMKDNIQIPMFKAREIAEGLFISSRTVSGAMRKLVSDGFVEKISQDPVVYSLTDEGKNIQLI